jgi:betaine-aldehyde dehydrogenase
VLHERIADEFLDRFVALARSIRVGNPMDPATRDGTLTSLQHRDRVLSYVDLAREQGGEVLAGGRAPADAALAQGCYVEPTVVHARSYRDRVAQEEVFGPFVTVLTFKDDAEALAIANCTEYGLGGGLWTTHLARAHRMAREMKSGMVWINSYKRVNPGSPFGGVGQSGYGREMGFDAMREYTQVKSVWVNVTRRSRRGIRDEARRFPMSFEFEAHIPRVVFGPGALQCLPAEVERLGARRALVLSTPGHEALRGASPSCSASAAPASARAR